MEMSCVDPRGECGRAAAAAWLIEVTQGGGFRAGKGILLQLNASGLRLLRGLPLIARTPAPLGVDTEAGTAWGRMQFLKDFRRRLEQLGPYPSLLVLAIPLVIVEPFKLVAVLVAGDGHFLTGLLFLICAYVVSLVVTERLFVILKPKLLMLPWFAKSWRWFIALRRRGLRWLRSLWTPAGKFLFGR
jgi:hypothetical protein